MNIRITLTGTDALLMHSARLANPLDEAARAVKKLTSKRTKTDADYAELARTEWTGGMYYEPQIGPYVPADNIWRALYDGGKRFKKGPRIKEALLITSNVNPLGYNGPRELDALWNDTRFQHHSSVRVGTSRTTRCRPHFPVWAVEADGILDTAILELDELKHIAETAGSLVGLGDWRPRFGRFTAEVAEA